MGIRGASPSVGPEEELRRSEERFRLLIDAVGDYAIYVLDAQGYVITWNTGAQKLKGYRAEEIIGKHFGAFFPSEDVKAGKPLRELALARVNGRFEEEGFRVRKDGSKFWAHVIVTPIREANGEIHSFAKVTRDLTARMEAERTAQELVREQAARVAAEEAEARLRQSEERYRALSEQLSIILEGIAEGITVQEPSGRVIFANRAAAQLSGFGSVQEFLQVPTGELAPRFQLLDQEGREVAPEALPGARVLRGEPSCHALLHVSELESGRHWWSLVRATGARAADGSPIAINIWQDVSESLRRERHERYLAQATAALSASLDYGEMLSTLATLLVPELADWCTIHVLEGENLMPVAVAHSDPEQVRFAREINARYPPRRDQSRGVWNVVRTGVSESYAEIPDALLADTAQDAEHLSVLRAAGIQAAVLVPIHVRERAIGVLSMICTGARRYDARDVALFEEVGRRAGTAIENARLYAAERSARDQVSRLAQAAQRAAREAEQAARRAEEANRVKDEFLATVSHELRTPLNAIVGWASLLRSRNPEPFMAKGLETIHRNALAQSKIIEDILDVSRIIAGNLRLELKPLNLLTTVRDAIEVARPSAHEKQIAIELLAPPEECWLVADAERLQQVLWNLLSNAVKFTEPGGHVRVELRREGSQVVLSVRDTGVGIDPSFLPFVFEPFKQADASTTRRVGGLGLGLSIVRHLVELHGGHIEVTSDGPGRGACFRVSLPVRAVNLCPPGQPLTEALDRVTAGLLAGKRVLVVDDERDARELLQEVLVDAGASVELASSAAEALEVFQAYRPDVLISDIGMPEEDGYTLMRRVRALEPGKGGQTPAVALTAYVRGQDKSRALSAGFTAHLGKPVNPDDLVVAVARLTGQLHA